MTKSFMSVLGVLIPASILIAQVSTPLCYDPVVYAGTQTGASCQDYCECPGRVLCASPGGTSIGGTITMTPLTCFSYTGGTSSGGRCFGGTSTGLPCGTTVVAIQACPAECEDGGGGEE